MRKFEKNSRNVTMRNRSRYHIAHEHQDWKGRIMDSKVYELLNDQINKELY